MEVLSFDAESDWLYDWEAVQESEMALRDWTDWDWDSERVPAVSNQSESRTKGGRPPYLVLVWVY